MQRVLAVVGAEEDKVGDKVAFQAEEVVAEGVGGLVAAGEGVEVEDGLGWGGVGWGGVGWGGG